MFRFIISNMIVFLCAARAAAYGIYTIRDKNRTGGISVFLLAAAAAAVNYMAYR